MPKDKDAPIVDEAPTGDTPPIVEPDAPADDAPVDAPPVVDEEPEPVQEDDIGKFSEPEGANPWVLICRDENNIETLASKVGQAGVVMARGFGMTFIPGVTIKQNAAGQNSIG